MIIKWIAEFYIKHACKSACDGYSSEYRDIQSLMFSCFREYDTESNDSTIYDFMLEAFNYASIEILPHVSKGLRK